jgi:hypothetical protein
MRICVTILVACFVFAATISARALAQPNKSISGAGDHPATAETGWQKVFREMAGEYEISSADSPRRACSLRTTPVLRWNQPVRGGDDGAVYVWLDNGRPAAIGTVFAWPLPDGDRVVTHEMHALAVKSLSAKYKGQEVWTVGKPALEFKPASNTLAPAESAPQRLAQIRALGREFTAKAVDQKEGSWELRLLGQPLYRYELKDDPDLLDGAVLAFVQGTDPEILLILEARRYSKQVRWEYALARFSDMSLFVQHNNVEVWNAPVSTPNDSKAPYFARNVEQRKPLAKSAENKKEPGNE